MPEVRFPALHMPEGRGVVHRTVRRTLLVVGVTLLLAALIPAGFLAVLVLVDVMVRLRQ